MTEQQFHTLANLIALSSTEREAAFGVIFNSEEDCAMSEAIVDRLIQADLAVRGAYVSHGPMEFRITVGHRDFHRVSGSVTLNIGDIVRLVALSTERWVPVRVTTLPKTRLDYYEGVITEQLVAASRYHVGNSVRFSEDQVLTPAPKAAVRGSRGRVVR